MAAGDVCHSVLLDGRGEMFEMCLICSNMWFLLFLGSRIMIVNFIVPIMVYTPMLRFVQPHAGLGASHVAFQLLPQDGLSLGVPRNRPLKTCRRLCLLHRSHHRHGVALSATWQVTGSTKVAVSVS